MFQKFYFQQSKIAAQKVAKFYFGATAVGATIGAAEGAFAASLLTGPTFISNVEQGPAKTLPGNIAHGLKEVGNIWLTCVGIGFWAGAAPVTYPISRLYEEINQSDSPTNTRPK